MKKIKILFTCPNYLPMLGGIENSTHNLAKSLIKKGFDVSVLCEKREFKDFEIIDNVKIYRYKRKSLPTYFKTFSMSYRQKIFSDFIKTFLKQNKFDLIIARFPFYVTPIKKTNPKIPVIYFQPSISYISLAHSAKFIKGLVNRFNQILRSKDMFKIEKKAVQNADLVIPRSKAMKWFNKNIFKSSKNINITIGGGIDHKKFKPEKKNKRLVEKFKLKGKKVVVCVSRLTPDKNNSGLLKAFKEVKTKDTVLLIVGGGVEMKRLKSLARRYKISKKVIFADRQKKPEKFYNLADIFVLASKQEGFGNVFVESLACGVPIIGFKANPPKTITAVEDIIGNKKCGFAVKNEKEMAKKIDYLLTSPRTLKQYKKNSIKRAKNFSWNNEANKLIKEIKKLV